MKQYEEYQIEGMLSPVIKATDEDGKVIYIPIDLANSDYQAYLASLDEASTL
jgi:hypothetical protein